MSTHTASHTAHSAPVRVLRVLTDPAACARWAPIDFSTNHARGEYLDAGSRTRLQGRIVGRNVTFEVDVRAAGERGLSLRATGPVALEVDYQLTPTGNGTLIEAQITLAKAQGMTGTLASHAINAILGARALRFALRGIAAAAEHLQQAARPSAQRWASPSPGATMSRNSTSVNSRREGAQSREQAMTVRS